MDKLFAKRMDELVPSGIRKVNEKALAMERAGETVIHFELGRPDFDTPEYIKNACIEDIKKGDVFYTSNFGTMELREAIAWKLKTQNNVEYKPTEIIVFPRQFLMSWQQFSTRAMRFWFRIRAG